MSENLVHTLSWKDCFDFLSEPYSFVVLFEQSTQELRLVVKLSPETLFVRQIVKDPTTDRFRLEFNLMFISGRRCFVGLLP